MLGTDTTERSQSLVSSEGGRRRGRVEGGRARGRGRGIEEERRLGRGKTQDRVAPLNRKHNTRKL